MDFKKLSSDDLSLIRGYFESANLRSCDYSVGGVFLWRDFFNTHYSVFNNTLVFRYNYFGGIEAYSAPIGEDPRGAYLKIAEYEKNAINFCGAPISEREIIKSTFEGCEVTVTPTRDWYDYLYDPKDFITFQGKKFSAKRNHINKFRSLYSDWQVNEITVSDTDALKQFCNELPENEESALASAEKHALDECFNNYAVYNFKGVMLTVNGKIAAFSIGDVIGDTLFVHFEKADTKIHGSYPVIANEFARIFATDVSYINREEDMGIEGLRKSKLSYYPVAFSEKADIKVKLK